MFNPFKTVAAREDDAETGTFACAALQMPKIDFGVKPASSSDTMSFARDYRAGRVVSRDALGYV